MTFANNQQLWVLCERCRLKLRDAKKRDEAEALGDVIRPPNATAAIHENPDPDVQMPASDSQDVETRRGQTGPAAARILPQMPILHYRSSRYAVTFRVSLPARPRADESSRPRPLLSSYKLLSLYPWPGRPIAHGATRYPITIPSASAPRPFPVSHQRAVDSLRPSAIIWRPNSMRQNTINVAVVDTVCGIKPELPRRTLEAQRL
jgi:hypothetical protein